MAAIRRERLKRFLVRSIKRGDLRYLEDFEVGGARAKFLASEIRKGRVLGLQMCYLAYFFPRLKKWDLVSVDLLEGAQ